MENIFVEPAREYRAPKFSRFGGMAPFAHNSAAPEMFLERDDDFSSILSEDNKETRNKPREYTAPKVRTRKSTIVNNVGLSKKEKGYFSKNEIPRRASKPLPRNIGGKVVKKQGKNVNKEKCSE